MISGHRQALIVHRDMTMLAALQHAFTSRGYKVVVARDLPTSLLAITQHHFDAAVVNSTLAENGDGFPLAGIIQRIFPDAKVSVIAPDVAVPELLAAINNGVRKLVNYYSGDADYLVASTLNQAETPARMGSGFSKNE
jgi:ActR/RegA family two-component response regulator